MRPIERFLEGVAVGLAGVEGEPLLEPGGGDLLVPLEQDRAGNVERAVRFARSS